MPAVEYVRASRRRRTPAGSSELWLADDHLLLVMRNWWNERYQRFRLSDIKAIVAVERPSLRGIQVVGLILTGSILGLTLWGNRSTVARVFLGGPLLFALIWQLVDVLRGPYCRVELITAVSAVRLTPLSRMRGAVKFLAQVMPMIEAVQGPIAPVIAPPPLPVSEWKIDSGTGAAAFTPPPLPGHERSRITIMEILLFVSLLLLGVYAITASRLTMPAMVSALAWTIAGLPVVLGGIIAVKNPHLATRVLGGVAAVAALVFGGVSVTHHFTAVFVAAREGEQAVREASRVTQPMESGLTVGIILVILAVMGLVAMALRTAGSREPQAN